MLSPNALIDDSRRDIHPARSSFTVSLAFTSLAPNENKDRIITHFAAQDHIFDLAFVRCGRVLEELL